MGISENAGGQAVTRRTKGQQRGQIWGWHRRRNHTGTVEITWMGWLFLGEREEASEAKDLQRGVFIHKMATLSTGSG